MHALDAAVGDLAAAVERDAVVERRLARDAEGRRLRVEDVREFRVAEQRLRGDAPDVQAHSAPVAFLDHRNAEAELCGADRGDVAARAGAEDDDIEVGGHADSLGVGAGPAAGAE